MRGPRAATICVDVADGRRFRRLQVLAEPRRGRRAAARASACGPRRLGRRRHEHDLLDAEADQLLEQPDRGSPGGRTADGSRRASSASGANVMACGSVASGTASAAATASARWSRPTPDRSSTSARRASAASVVGRRTRSRRRASATSAKTRSRCASTSCADDQQLAEARLAEVLGQQLRVAPRRARRRPAASSCAAPRTRSHSTRPAVIDRRRAPRAAPARSRHQNGPAPAAGPRASQAAHGRDDAAAPSTSSTRRGSHVGSAVGRERRLRERAGSAPTSPPAPPTPTILQHESRSGRRPARPPSTASGTATSGDRQRQRPDDQPRRPRASR